MTEFTDLDGLAGRVASGTTVAVGGALFSRLPLALIRAVLRRRPRDLHYVAWGGGLPLEMFLEASALRRLSFCFSSLDVFGLAPRFRAALEDGAVEVDEWTALGMIQALDAAGRRLPAGRLPLPHTEIGPQRVDIDPGSGRELGVVPALPVDTLLLHATRADTHGNIELQGTRGLDLALIPAARRVLVTVEEVVARGALGAPRSQLISRHLISAIAVVPGGAFPSSCLPAYAADYRSLAGLAEDPLGTAAGAPERLDLSRRAAGLDAERVTAAQPAPRPAASSATAAETMMAWLARAYEPGSVFSAGAVSPLALGSYLLALRSVHPAPALLTTSGSYVDVEPRPLLLGLGEVLDFASAPVHVGSDESYRQLYQTGAVDYEVVNVAQIDATAATNNVWVTSPSGRRIRLPGQGGMADVADMHANFMLYQPRQSPLTLVERVGTVSAARRRHDPAERAAAGYRPGRTVVVTDLAVFERDDSDGRLRPVSLHPGVTVERLARETGFAVGSGALPVTAAPSAETLRLLRGEVDPLGLRDLEFTAARDRGAVLARILDAEDALIDKASR